MPSLFPSFILGYHGCDESVGNTILNGDDQLRPSKNEYDWLGHGIYFWESDAQRAYDFAVEVKNNPKKSRGKIINPFVVGAIIDLGNCLNLLDSHYLELLKKHHQLLKDSNKNLHLQMPKNTKDKTGKIILRQLDCSVIEFTIDVIKRYQNLEFDSVRSVFVEGCPIYEDTDICDKNHIQICVRNPICIRGYFKPINHPNYL
jgi:hypothetical protein